VKILLHIAFFYLLILFAPRCVSQTHNNVVNIAKSYVGIKETKKNSSPLIDKFLYNVNSKPGNPWCSAFVSWCLDSANITTLKIRSALARNFIIKSNKSMLNIKAKSISAKKVIINNMDVPSGSIIVWRKGQTIFGHVGIVNTWNKNKGITIEGNTSPDNYSNTYKNQYNGQGVYIKKRYIIPTNYFRITDFTLYE
jgi:hypothetical protein